MNGTVSEHIVIIEDDPANREGFRRILQKAGYRVTACGTADEGLEELRRAGDVALIITDLRMPGKDGMAVLAEARAIDSRVGLLMVTAHGTVPLAVEAIKQGADDFLLKPIDDIEQLRLKVGAVLRTRRLERENVELRTRIGELASLGGLIGRAASMQRLYKQIEMVSPTRSTVLIIGESGTGKELVANAIHENSPRRSERFLPINCGAIPGEILESELFGHEKGSFTGAASRKIGKFELADRGTIFLDEIGELPSDMQVKLLRVLEGMEFMRVGGTETIRVDVRVLAATNADLESAVAAGRFRSDLYYRLKVVTIKIPPLRERREDIPVLIEHFLRRYGAENKREGLSLTPGVLRMLVNHPWEGNVRELKNLIESLVVLAPGSSIDVPDLPPEYLEGAGTRMVGAGDAGAGSGWGAGSGGARAGADTGPGRPGDAGGSAGGGRASATMEDIEREAILRALEECGGNRTQAAERLGIGLRTLQRKLKEYKGRGLA
jgi:DNA-binding NtrC family response regulator